jgi:hypothetical protein
MTVSQRILTFAAGAQQFPAPPTGVTVASIFAFPLRSNTHVSYVGISTVTNDASGTGVIKEIAQPPAATVGTDSFVKEDMEGANTIDPTQFYAHGTTGEKLLVTYFQR